MAKLFSKMKIIMPGDVVIPARTVFDATPSEAKQFDALKSARPATAAEIKAHAEAQAKADGSAFAG